MQYVVVINMPKEIEIKVFDTYQLRDRWIKDFKSILDLFEFTTGIYDGDSITLNCQGKCSHCGDCLPAKFNKSDKPQSIQYFNS